MDAPREMLYRGLAEAPATRTFERSAADGGEPTDGTTMFGHFTVFDQWYRIDSWYEGTFMERVAPGALAKTIAERGQDVRVQFDHGHDSYVGDAPLGPIDVLREDEIGGYYEVPLLDTDYNRNRILPMLQGRLMNGEQRGSMLGASFRMRVIKDDWNDTPTRSDANPDGIPERTIREIALYEFGPVVFPASPAATSGVRSLTDHYLDLARSERSQPTPAEPSAGPTTDDEATDEPARSHSTETGRLLTVATTEILRLRKGAR